MNPSQWTAVDAYLCEALVPSDSHRLEAHPAPRRVRKARFGPDRACFR